MKLLVCIKPDIAGQTIGPYELLALEAGLSIKDAWDAHAHNTESRAWLDVIFVGSDASCLHRALGLGADQGLHVQTHFSDTLVPAAVIAGLLTEGLNAFVPLDPKAPPGAHDLILTGMMSQDLMAGQTGPMAAQIMGIHCAAGVSRVALAEDPDKVRLFRQGPGGAMEEMEMTLPGLVSVQAGWYTPRYPTLSQMLGSRQKPVKTIDGTCLPVPGAVETFSLPRLPEISRKAIQVSGDLEQKKEALDAFMARVGVI